MVSFEIPAVIGSETMIFVAFRRAEETSASSAIYRLGGAVWPGKTPMENDKNHVGLHCLKIRNLLQSAAER